jgi:hypothetical protein
MKVSNCARDSQTSSTRQPPSTGPEQENEAVGMIAAHVDACVDPVELVDTHAWQADADSYGHVVRPFG